MRGRRLSRRAFLNAVVLSTGAVAAAGLAACQPAAPAAPAGSGARDQAAPAAKKSLTTINVLVPIAATTGAVVQAMHRGYMAEQGLEVELQEFASGTTALETWQTGVGHFVHGGDLPALTAWIKFPTEYRVASPFERSGQRYIGIARSDVKTAQDLVGKTVATRVGSTGSYFISRYLKKNNVDASKVTVVNLDADKLAPAIDRGDIDAFFIWEPFGQISQRISGSKVHQLTTADGYVQGYSMIGTRPAWAQANLPLATGYLRALKKMLDQLGDPATRTEMASLLKQRWGMAPEDTELQLKLFGWVMKFDKIFYDDFVDQFAWAQETGAIAKDKKLSFKEWCYMEPLRGVDASLVAEPPS